MLRAMSRVVVGAVGAVCGVSGWVVLCVGWVLCAPELAQAQAVGNPYTYSRTSAFTYRADGLLESEKVEPDVDKADLCVLTTYGYDEYGNKTSSVTSACAGASAGAQFATRSSSSDFKVAQSVVVPNGAASATVSVPLGSVAGSSTNALGQSESRVVDPRFGALTSLTGPNGLSTTWQLDGFGRVVLEIRADGTRTATAYCLLQGRGYDTLLANATTNPNSSQCASLSYGIGEVPTDAVSVVHVEPRKSDNGKIGPFSRVYLNRAGQKIRSVTEAFDGPAQPGGASRLIVQDVDYNAYGVQTLSTQPYFLDSGSSLASGLVHYGMTLTEVDVLGRPTKVYRTDPSAMPAQSRGSQGGSQTSVTFGGRGSYQASLTQISYGVLTVTTIDDKGQSRLEEKNIDGKLARVTDALGAQLAHQYDAFGNLVLTKDALQNRVTLSYDIRGRKTQLVDPDSGTWTYGYDALGQLTSQQGPEQFKVGTRTLMSYDLLGRMSSRTEPEYTSTWYYDKNADGSACGKGVGKLCESSTSNGVRKRISYDSLGRPQANRTDITNGPSFGSALSYDVATGRLDTQTYPSGLSVKFNYTPKGYLLSLNTVTALTINPLPASPGGPVATSRTYAAQAALWTAQATNAWGQAEASLLGNDLSAQANFDPMSGRPIRHTVGAGVATTVQDYNYVWDSLGRLAARSDANGDGSTGAVTDNFSYDAIGRLNAYSVASSQIPNLSRTVVLRYDALGKVTYKSDVGTYTYPAQGATAIQPHAVQSISGTFNATYLYDGNGNLSSATGGAYRSVKYTSFNLPDSLTGVQGPAGNLSYTWQYDENHQRLKEVRTVGSGASASIRTTWMLHPDNQGGLGFETEMAPDGATISQRHYLSAGGTTLAVLVSRGALPNLGAALAPSTLGTLIAVKLEYWHKDHLGSLVATTDHLGNVTDRYAYDPFGKRRIASGQYDSFGTLVVDWTTNTNRGTDRGYTGHEHLDDVGIIHMNGRLFDPLVGRFMQPDPFIQDPANLQNYDRFGYCYNSPTGCTDPSGYCFMGCAWQPMKHVNTVMRLGYEISGFKMLGISYQNYRLAASIAFNVFVPVPGGGSIFTAALQGFASGAIASGNTKGALQGAFTAGMFYGVGNVIQGGNFFTGGVDQAAAWGSYGKVALHGVAGCVTSMASGGECGSGAMSAAFSAVATVNGWQFEGKAGVVSAAIIGGTASVLGGGKFANGAQTAAFAYLFNHLVHSAAEARALYGKGAGPGHHWVPFGSTTGLDISVEAREVWGLATNGADLPSSVHRWDPDHVAYNAAVRDELLKFSESRGIDLAKMTADEARDFMGSVKTSNSPAISRLVTRIETYMSRSPSVQRLIRGLSAVGAMGVAEWFYPSPMRAPQCQFNPNADGC